MLAHYNRSASNLEQLRQEAGFALTLVQANLTKEDDVEKLFKERPCQILVGEFVRGTSRNHIRARGELRRLFVNS